MTYVWNYAFEIAKEHFVHIYTLKAIGVMESTIYLGGSIKSQMFLKNSAKERNVSEEHDDLSTSGRNPFLQSRPYGANN